MISKPKRNFITNGNDSALEPKVMLMADVDNGPADEDAPAPKTIASSEAPGPSPKDLVFSVGSGTPTLVGGGKTTAGFIPGPDNSKFVDAGAKDVATAKAKGETLTGPGEQVGILEKQLKDHQIQAIEVELKRAKARNGNDITKLTDEDVRKAVEAGENKSSEVAGGTLLRGKNDGSGDLEGPNGEKVPFGPVVGGALKDATNESKKKQIETGNSFKVNAEGTGLEAQGPGLEGDKDNIDFTPSFDDDGTIALVHSHPKVDFNLDPGGKTGTLVNGKFVDSDGN